MLLSCQQCSHSTHRPKHPLHNKKQVHVFMYLLPHGPVAREWRQKTEKGKSCKAQSQSQCFRFPRWASTQMAWGTSPMKKGWGRWAVSGGVHWGSWWELQPESRGVRLLGGPWPTARRWGKPKLLSPHDSLLQTLQRCWPALGLMVSPDLSDDVTCSI